MSRKQTQAYTEEFRREAVRRADQPDNTAAAVALGHQPSFKFRSVSTALSVRASDAYVVHR